MGLSEERDKIALCFQGDICPESQPSASDEQLNFTPVTGTEESLLLVTEEPYDSSSLKYEEINDDKTDHSSIIKGIGSDFISLESEKKTNKSLHSTLHLRTTGITSHNSKIKYAEDLINLNGGVLSPCKKQERSLSERAFTTEDARCDQQKDAIETEWQILSDMDFSVQKKRWEVEIDDRTVGDLQEKKRKYSLRQIIWLPMNSLPLPRLSRDAIVGFVEEQTRDGHGGSTLPPSEHEDLSEMLRLLATDNVPGPQITMKYEMLRLCTMKTFPGRDRPFAIRIVGAGFYYAGHKDQVVCYCCGNRKDSWVIGDIPLLIHQNMAPDCGFFTNNARFNVPIRKANSSESPSLAEVRLLAVQRFYGSNQSDTAQGESSLMLPSCEQNQQHSVSDNLPTVSAHVDSVLEPPPKYPQYAVKNMRINSFQGWPAELQQKPEEMAECGFYYAGFNDCVRCFHCGVGLRHWMSEDDPWIEHARWSTSCAYVLKMKGEEFVSLIKMAVEIVEREEAKSKNGGGNQALQNSNETATVPVVPAMEVPKESDAANSSAAKDFPGSVGATDGNVVKGAASTPSHGNTEIQKYLLTDATQSVLDMRYQPKLVLRAIERVLIKKGSDALTREIIMEAVFEIDEENIIQSQTQPVPLQSAEEDKVNENGGKEWTSYYKSFWPSDGKSQVDSKKWYLYWSHDHPVFSNGITDLAILFGTEPLPARSYIAQNDDRYRYECVRLTTFSQYRGPGFGTRLAQSGFVYDPSRNMVVCPWDGSDVSSDITRNQHFMSCAFMRQFYWINIPLHEACSPPLPVASDMAATMTFSHATEEQQDMIQSQTETYSIEVTSREEPNQNAGSGLGQSSEVVNAADIGPIGLTDQEERHCNNLSGLLSFIAALVGMISRENDIDTNYTEDQARNTSSNYHSNTVDSVVIKEVSASTGVAVGNATGAAASTPSHGNTEVQKYLLTDAVQNVLDMGYQPKLVQWAIERILLNKGTEELTGQIILEAVFEIEEETLVQPQHQQAAQSAEGHESIGKGHEASGNTQAEGSQIDPEKIIREHRELRDATLCKICMENPISVVFLPCGHQVTCSDCAPAMRRCPICRTLIKGTVKTFCG